MKHSIIIAISVFLFLVVSPAFAQKGMRLPSELANSSDLAYRVSWALIIGINKYPYLPPQFQLNYAVADARALGSLLQGQFGFEKNNVMVLEDERATKQRIMNALSSFADPDRVKERDCLLVFFSGHGQTVPLPKAGGGGDMGFLVPYDAQVDLSEKPNAAQYDKYCIPMEELLKKAKLIPAKHIIFIVDACYSGLVLGSSRGLDGKIPSYLKKVAPVPVRQIITAGGKGEESMELPELGHGLFTYKLLDVLSKETADINNDGVITGFELGSYLRITVPIAPGANQIPQFRTSSEGEFLFLRAAGEEDFEEPIVAGGTEDEVTPSADSETEIQQQKSGVPKWIVYTVAGLVLMLIIAMTVVFGRLRKQMKTGSAGGVEAEMEQKELHRAEPANRPKREIQPKESSVMQQEDRMIVGRSKYDPYWRSRLGDIKRLIKEAYENTQSSELDISGIRRYGDRASWSGVVKVSGSGLEKGEMAHVRSLGRIIQHNNLLESYGESGFRIRISADLKLKVWRLERVENEGKIAEQADRTFQMEQRTVWVNIDKPTGRCTIHADPNCTDVRKWLPQIPTAKKSLGLPLGGNGGWIPFETLEEAKRYCRNVHPNYKKSQHC